MPLVLIECMKYGLPFIAYNVGAIKELAEDCKNGIVVTKFDHQGFCNEAIRLLDNNHQRQALSKMEEIHLKLNTQKNEWKMKC